MRLPGIKPIPKVGVLVVVGSLLGGCGGGDFADLQSFMADVDSRPAPPVCINSRVPRKTTGASPILASVTILSPASSVATMQKI